MSSHGEDSHNLLIFGDEGWGAFFVSLRTMSNYVNSKKPFESKFGKMMHLVTLVFKFNIIQAQIRLVSKLHF